MTVAPGDLFRVNAVGNAFGQLIILTHAYTVLAVTPGTGELAVTTSVLEALRGGGGGDLFETKYLDCLPLQYTLNYWRAQKTNPIRYRYAKWTRDEPGTHAAPTSANNQSAVITFNTLLAGRSQLSNKHIGPIPQGALVQANGLITAAYATKLETLATGMEQQIVDAGIGLTMTPVIPHKTPAGSYTLIVSHNIQSTLRVMRRRTLGVGE